VKNPLVSIIITTKNSAATLKDLLKSIKNQSYKNIEIILVDNNSSDKTLEITKKFTNKIWNLGPERSAQRNFGVKKSKGKFVMILDSDMVLNKKIVEECVDKILSNPEYKALVIPEESFGKGVWSKAKAFERSFYLGDKDIEAARFFDKRVFNEFEGYDLGITGPEDWDLPKRIAKKYQVGRISSFILHNEGQQTLFGLMKKKFYYAKKASIYLKKHHKNTISPTTVYFLRPAFYKNWKKIVLHPIISIVMVTMLIAELFWGGVGFLVGKISHE
jgi:glycosyltransferase involved in cell wall biosynthesis